MDFDETDEQRLLRVGGRRAGRAVRPRRTSLEQGQGRRAAPHELWDEVGRLGFLGVNVPEEYGGGGGGMVELAIVARGAGRGRLPAAAAWSSRRRSAATVIGRYGTDEQKRALAARARRRRAQDGVRDHRAGRRLELAPAHHRGPPGRRRLGAHAAASTTSPGSTRPTRVLVVGPDRGRPAPGRCGRRCSSCRPTRPGLSSTLDPGGDHRPGEAVHAVLRRRPAAGRRAGRRAEDAGLAAAVRRAQPGADHGAALGIGIGRYALRQGRRRTRAPGRSGACRSAPTRASRTRWRTRADPGRAGPADDARRRPGSTTPATTRGRRGRQHGQVRRRRGGDARRVDQAIQTHGGNGLSTEYGLADALGRDPAAPHRPGQPRDDPQLRRPALPRPAPSY